MRKLFSFFAFISFHSIIFSQSIEYANTKFYLKNTLERPAEYSQREFYMDGETENEFSQKITMTLFYNQNDLKNAINMKLTELENLSKIDSFNHYSILKSNAKMALISYQYTNPDNSFSEFVIERYNRCLSSKNEVAVCLFKYTIRDIGTMHQMMISTYASQEKNYIKALKDLQVKE